MPYLLIFIKRRMSMHLSYGFDVGRGYVAGEEEVRKLIDHLTDHKDIGKSMKQVCDNGRLEVIRCLGMVGKLVGNKCWKLKNVAAYLYWVFFNQRNIFGENMVNFFNTEVFC